MKKLLHLVLWFSYFASLAQNAPASPHVAGAEALFKPNLYTGGASAQVPICTYVSKDISIPIVLNYTGGNGLHVNEESSWVGLGWHLSCGGFISQSVRGYNDFYPDLGYLVNTKGIPNVNYVAQLPIVNPKDYWNQNVAAGWETADLQPDLYSISLPGISTTFSFDKKKNAFVSSGEPLNIQIEIGTEKIMKVKVQDGLEYTFKELETALSLNPATTETSLLGSTWFVTSIYSPLSGETVTFNYVASSSANNGHLQQNTYSKTTHTLANSSFYLYPIPTWPDFYQLHGGCSTLIVPSSGSPGTLSICPDNICNTVKPADEIKINKSLRKLVYLSNITGSTGKVYFKTSYREDLGGESFKLDTIVNVVFDEKGFENKISKHVFSYNYFLSEANLNPASSYFEYPYPDKIGKRLKLTSYQHRSGDNRLTLPAYQFQYNETVKLPYKTSFDIDYWGYYNYLVTDPSTLHNTSLLDLLGSTNRMNRNSIGTMASAGMIKKIINPLGATTEYEYEPSGAGVRISKIHTYETYPQRLTKKYSYYKEPTSPFIFPTSNYLVKKGIEYTGTSAVYQLQNPVRQWVANGSNQLSPPGGAYAPTNYIMGKSATICDFNAYVGTSSVAFGETSYIPLANYTMITEFEGENGEMGKTEYYYPKVSYLSQFYFNPLRLPFDGKLIKKIVYENKNGQFKNKLEEQYVYTYKADPDNFFYTEISSDQPDWQNNEFLRSTVIGGVLEAAPGPNGNNTLFKAYYFYPYQLLRVSTTKKEYDLNSTSLAITSQSTQLINPDGTLKSQTTQRVGSDKIYKQELFYKSDLPSTIASLAPITRYLPIETISSVLSASSNTVLNTSSEINVFNSKNLLTEKWVSNVPVTLSKNLSTSTTFLFDSKYKKVVTNTYNSSGLINQQDAGLKVNSSSGYSSTFTSSSTLYGYNGKYPIATVHNADLTQIAYNGFESGQLGTEGWDGGTPNKVFIIDKNAEPDNVFSGRFSIKLNPGTSVSSSPAFVLTPAQQKGKYKLSAWLKVPATITTSNVYLSLHTCKASNPLALSPASPFNNSLSYVKSKMADWQYVETVLDFDYLKSLADTVPLSIRCVVANKDQSASIYIDDIRLHPLDAQMSTFTYLTGVGKTSEAGVNNKPVHYEYDALGRLLYTKDFRKNLVQMYQYSSK